MSSEHVPHLQRMANEAWRGSPEHAALDAAIASLSAPNGEVVVTRDEAGAIVAVTRQDAEGQILSVIAEAAQQPASDGGFTAADMMDARQEGRKEAQQPAAVDGADAKDAEIERMRAEREVIGAEAVKYAEKSGRLEAKVDRMADALREAMEWNWIDGDVPDAIQVKARDALRDHDQDGGNP